MRTVDYVFILCLALLALAVVLPHARRKPLRFPVRVQVLRFS